VDHRPARRHDQLPAWLSAICRVHRPAAQGSTRSGGVYDPVRNDLYTASRGRGAFLNERRIRVSKREQASGRPDRHRLSVSRLHPSGRLHRHVPRSGAEMLRTAPPRRGRAGPGLAGRGTYRRFLRDRPEPWDIAAGCLLVQEAGGLVSDFTGESGFLDQGHVVAGNPRVFAQLLQAIAPHVTPALKAPAGKS
jgi:myo-inositol-1(or 4)-monophosphatase